MMIPLFDLSIVALEKTTGFVPIAVHFLGSYQVTAIMFAVYLGALYLVMTRLLFIETPVFVRLTLAGISFGMFSHVLVQVFNHIRLLFGGDTTGIMFVVLVGPIQEEVSKFVFFLLSFFFIEWISRKRQFTYERLRGLVLLGVSVGLAFAVVENLLSYGYLDSMGTFFRTLFCWPMHLITAGLSAYGFFKFQTARRISVPIIFLLSAVVFHIVFNLANVLF